MGELASMLQIELERVPVLAQRPGPEEKLVVKKPPILLGPKSQPSPQAY